MFARLLRWCEIQPQGEQRAVQLEGVNSFVFTQTLQQSVNLDPVIESSNHLCMRRVNGEDYRAIISTLNRIIE